MNFQPSDISLLLQGLLTTLDVVVWTLVISTVTGIALGTLRFLNIPVAAQTIRCIVEVTRMIPMVLLMVGLLLVMPFSGKWLVVLVLSLYNSAAASEIVRGGLQSIDKAQLQAAKVLGLSLRQRMLHIAIPQSCRKMLPALISQASVIVKDSTIGSLAVLELTKAVNILNIRYLDASAEWMVLVALTYFALSYSISALGRMAEKKLAY